MQPRPPISDVLWGFDKSSTPSLYDPDTAYVGLVEETGSLFVMSNDRFPLIAFGDTEYSINSHAIDPPPSAIPRTDLLDRVDEITKRRKLRELCAESPFNTQCLTGKRPLDASSLNSRQLPGVPSVELPPNIDLARNIVDDTTDSLTDIPDTTNNLSAAVSSPASVPSAIRESYKMTTTFVTLLLAIVSGSLFLFRDRLYPSTPPLTPDIQNASISSITQPAATGEVPEAPSAESLGAMVLPPSDVGSSPPTPVPVAADHLAQLADSHVPSQEAPDPPGISIIDDIEESEREGDVADVTPKKRKVHRRRRGKKGKGNHSAAAGAVDDTEGEMEVDGVIGSKEDSGRSASEEKIKVSGSTTLVVQSTLESVTSSLVVSDTVLGECGFYCRSCWFGTAD